MTSPGQSIGSLNFSTSQALGAGIAAGALALYVWRRSFRDLNASVCDTPEAGSESDQVVLYGKGAVYMHTYLDTACSTSASLKSPSMKASELFFSHKCPETERHHLASEGLFPPDCFSGPQASSDFLMLLHPSLLTWPRSRPGCDSRDYPTPSK